MNILPKKRWHVRTKANIERVRRDEVNAAAEEKERQRKIQLAEQEARTTILRRRAKGHLSNEETKPGGNEDVPQNCLNLFRELDQGQKSWGTNQEHEEEKKQEREKFEKSVGILTYLGQNSGEGRDAKPWYTEFPSNKRVQSDLSVSEESKRLREEISQKTKSYLDPLRDLKKYTALKNPKEIESKNKTTKIDRTFPASDGKIKYDSDKKEKRKKHKLEKSKKRKREKEKLWINRPAKKLNIEALRAERLKRESDEKKKAESLLAKCRGETTPQKPPSPLQDGRQRYNSQFNPHLARQTKSLLVQQENASF